MAAAPRPNDDVRAARLHLTALFGTKTDDLHVVLFRLNPARAQSFADIDAAADSAAGQADVYVHVGLARHPFNGSDRPQALEIAAIGGLWADIDIADAVHKKPGLPPNQDAALQIVQAMRLPPGFVIHSGHGLQVWWPFAEVWTFDTPDEQRRARILARAWAITLRERAKTLGYAVDMVSDVSRVFRVAGTVNRKGTPVPVQIVQQTGATISEDDVLGALLDGAWEQAERDIDQKKGSGDQIVYGELILDPAADPPWDKLDILRDVEPRFDQSWRRHRTKRSENWSSSEWDQSLAAYAAQAGWSRQEIADLLIASRRKHGDDLKLRQDYYGNTITKATAGREGAEAVREAVAVSTQLTQEPADERPEGERTDILATISKSLGVEIAKVTRSRAEPPTFGIETPYGKGSLGGIESIISNRRFRVKVAEITNRIPRKLKDEAWDPIAQALLQVAEPEDLGVEATVAGHAETLLSLYLGSAPPQSLDRMDERTRQVLPVSLLPFVGADGRTRIFARGFKTWLAEVQHENLTSTEIGTMLRAIGCVNETQNFRLPTRRSTRSVWVLPPQETGDE